MLQLQRQHPIYGTQPVYVVPEEAKQSVLESLPPGLPDAEGFLRSRYWWPEIAKDVRNMHAAAAAVHCAEVPPAVARLDLGTLSRLQMEDELLNTIIWFFGSGAFDGEGPDSAAGLSAHLAMRCSSPQATAARRQKLAESWQSFCYLDRVLKIRVPGPEGAGTAAVPVVPKIAEQMALEQAHLDMLHDGSGTFDTFLRARYWWPGIDEAVARVVAECPLCAGLAGQSAQCSGNRLVQVSGGHRDRRSCFYLLCS
jgi:hypothetical protein